MYALIVPASVPFVLLATVMGLSWWEDHILPTAEPVEAPFPPTAPARLREPAGVDTALTQAVGGR
ncbi:hypothetical protein [Streptomyces fulvoviolaceus]|uniref:hypothetical protein n=1 Tax=Streptomyces fulvoviolaceus TaxID=285535 RepID=UPI0004C81FDD|nr:hypothetical protein [Streptomyces fulvoviolaceus]